MSLSVLFGYLHADGTRDEVVVSPSDLVSVGTLLDRLIEAALAITKDKPLWVESGDADTAAALAVQLGVPVGRPADWNPVPTDSGLGV